VDLTVVVATGHPALRATLRRLLEDTPGMSVAGVAGDLALTRQHVAGHRPDVLVLDGRMPDGSGFDAVGAIRELVPGTHVVVIGIENTPAVAERALRSGASGYVLKERAAEDLPAAVRAAATAKEFVSEPVARRLDPRLS
jgi:DNA-binding NarL/FixJ family response regulator